VPVSNERGQSVTSLTKAPVFKLKREHRGVMACLSDQQREQLHEWFKTLSYNAIVVRCMEEWGLKVWPTQLVRYHQKFLAANIIDRRKRTVAVLGLVNDEIDRTPADYARAILDNLGRQASDAIHDPAAHQKVIIAWVETFNRMRHSEKSIQLWERKLALKERELDFREKQLEAAKETVQDSTLSAEEQAERFRQIFQIGERKEAQTNGRHQYNGDFKEVS
jgi:hypothetical protein